MSSVDERSKAFDQARTNIAAALKTAKSIRDPWYRVQSLAEVARYASAKEADSIIRLAMKAVEEARDDYRFVAVSAWPLAALISHDRLHAVATLMPSILERSDRIVKKVNQSDALILVFEAICSLDPTIYRPVLVRLVNCAKIESGWHCARNLAAAVEYTAHVDLPLAASLVESIRPGQFRNRAVRCIEACAKGEASKPWSRFYG